jgi:hypothetical protein
VAGSPYWIYINSVTVEEGDTLTIEPGVVIKSVEGNGGLTVEGTLLANGTAMNPIIFTSEKDDSVGGDTNGDGNGSTPQAGDWDDVFIRENGTAHLDHCHFKYGGENEKATLFITGMANVSNCHFETAESRIGPSQTYDADVSFSNLTFGSEIYAGIGLDDWFFETSGLYTLPNYPSWPYLLMEDGSTERFNIPSGTTIVAEAGTVFKFVFARRLFIEGKLDVNGTDGTPVIFTSIKDDTAGGDTNQDGNTTMPVPDDWFDIFVPFGGGGFFDYTEFRYGDLGVQFIGAGDALNCHFSEMGQGIGVSRAISASVNISNLGFGSGVNKGVGLLAPTALGNFFLPKLDTSPYLIGATGLSLGNGVQLTLEPGCVFKFLEEGKMDVGAGGILNAIGSSQDPIIFTSIKDDTYMGDSNQDGNATMPMPGDWWRILCQGSSDQLVAEANFDHCKILYAGGTQLLNGIIVANEFNALYYNQFVKGTLKNTFFEAVGTQFPILMHYRTTSEVDVENLSFGSNAYKGIELSFAVNNANLSDTIKHFEGYPYLLKNNVEFFSIPNVAIAVEAGTVFKMLPGGGTFGEEINWDLTIDLIAKGTADEPIVFTSLYDDAYGGDTEQNGNATSPNPGDWGKILIEKDNFSNPVLVGSAQMEHCIFAYGGADENDAALKVEGSADLKDCTFKNFLCDIPFSKDIHAQLSLDSVDLDSSLFDLIQLFTDFNPDPGNVSLSPLEYPYYFANTSPIYIRNGLNITIKPGTIFKGNGLLFLQSTGSLELQSTKEQPIVFTSVKDDLFGGDSNKDGLSSSPAMLEGGSIYSSSGALGTVENMMFRYGNVGLIVENDSLEIKNTTFYKNRIGLQIFDNPAASIPLIVHGDSLCFLENETGIQFLSADSFIVENSKFEGNTKFALENASANPLFGLTPQLAQAPNNWWGDTSGPYHPLDNPAGMGDTITDLVNFMPFNTSSAPSEPVAVCQDITVELDSSGTAEISLTTLDGGSTDDCCFISIPDSSFTLDCSHLGHLSIPLFVYDGVGNQDSCQAQVTVEDKLPPSLLCRDITLEITQGGSESITPAQLIESSSDNCGIVNTIINQSQFDAADEGVNSVLVVVEDAAGFGTSCTALVSVTVLEDSTTLCPDSLAVDQVPVPSGNYQAANFLSSTGLINAGDSVCFIAGQEILLSPGFEALEGSLFKAFIDSCQSTFTQEEYAVLSSKANEKRQVLNSLKQLSLECSPNPFRESVSLTFFLPEPAPVEIRIFDLAGKQVFSFESLQVLPKGYYHKNLSNEIQEAGYYIVHLAAGKNRLSRKIVKLR